MIDREYKSTRRALGILIGVIMIMWVGAVQVVSQNAEAEAALRKRIAAFWDAMQAQNFEAATQFVHPDLRSLFTHRVAKPRVLKWTIDKLSFDKDYTACDTVTIVTIPTPIDGSELGWPLNHTWVLKDGSWYFKFPWADNENPFVKLFRAEKEATAAAPISEGAPARPSKPLTVETIRSLQRFMPAPSNPNLVHTGEKSILRFLYRNTGTVPIKILSVYADCHCTGVKKDYPEIAPGENGTLEVTLDTFGLPLGRLEKQVAVQFSDLSEPEILRIGIDNVANFTLSPPAIDFGILSAGTETEKFTQVVNRSGRRVKILFNVKTDPRLDVSLDKTNLEPGETVVISLRYRAGAPGEYLDNLMLRTDLEAEPLINIPIRGRVGP